MLRELLGDAAARPAVVGVRVARELIAGALHALLTAPQSAAAVREPARLVTETYRHDPPVKLHAFTVAEDVEVAGERVAAGEQVAVVVGAANRDPDAFTAPDRFAPDRYAADGAPAPLVPAPHGVAVESFARVQAEAVLAAVAAAPGLPGAAGSAVRLPRSPVTWGWDGSRPAWRGSAAARAAEGVARTTRGPGRPAGAPRRFPPVRRRAPGRRCTGWVRRCSAPAGRCGVPRNRAASAPVRRRRGPPTRPR